jgi:hypothetical protein
LPNLQRGLNDTRIALGPVVATFGDQPHEFVLALEAKAIALIFDFIKPLRAGGYNFADIGNKIRTSILDRR